MQTDNESEDRVEVTTGNVFAAIGLPNPDEYLRKAQLMRLINNAIRRNGYTQVAAAQAAGIDQSDISNLSRGKGTRYSTDRLLSIISRLGLNVELTQSHDENGAITVSVRELVS